MQVFSANVLNELSQQAKDNPRRRQHRNIHQSYQDPCQRLFNAIEPDSYIHPHRHASDPRDEMLVAIRGLMALITFNNEGKIKDTIFFGTEKLGTSITTVVEISSSVWHTVVALEPGSVLLEVKAGPFNPSLPKDLANWAPRENSDEAKLYLSQLFTEVNL